MSLKAYTRIFCSPYQLKILSKWLSWSTINYIFCMRRRSTVLSTQWESKTHSPGLRSLFPLIWSQHWLINCSLILIRRKCLYLSSFLYLAGKSRLSWKLTLTPKLSTKYWLLMECHTTKKLILLSSMLSLFLFFLVLCSETSGMDLFFWALVSF